jgi:hypothetical protein
LEKITLVINRRAKKPTVEKWATLICDVLCGRSAAAGGAIIAKAEAQRETGRRNKTRISVMFESVMY